MGESVEREYIRVGTDLIRVDEVAESIARFGDRYLHRVYTAQEAATCSGPDGPSAERLAARFAAKESVVKVLRPPEGVNFRDIEVRHDGGGAPEVVFDGELARHALRLGVVDSSLSMTHDGGLASAVFVAVFSGNAPATRNGK
ncbi:MAG: holo-ACP synthase [Acidimicrobiales bacterium]